MYFSKGSLCPFCFLITPIYLFAFCILAQKSDVKYQRWKSLRFSAGAFQKPELHSSNPRPSLGILLPDPPKFPATGNGSLQLPPCLLVSSIHPSEKGDENTKERDSAIPRNNRCSFPLHIPPLGTTRGPQCPSAPSQAGWCQRPAPLDIPSMGTLGTTTHRIQGGRCLDNTAPSLLTTALVVCTTDPPAHHLQSKGDPYVQEQPGCGRCAPLHTHCSPNH